MNLQKGNIVRLRNGKLGAVVSFNDEPMNDFIIFDTYIEYARKYNMTNGKHFRKPDYDIISILDGSPVNDVKLIYTKTFIKTTLPNLDVIWLSDDVEGADTNANPNN